MAITVLPQVYRRILAIIGIAYDLRADDTLVNERIDKYVLRVRDLPNDQKTAAGS